jgi:non-specific serine/threonine protein kinase
MQLKRSDKDVREIARLLDVQYVLEGSVRKAGNKLRITAQLIQADNDRHLWAEKYDGVLEDVFDIQENVSRRIVEALKGRITPKDQQQLSARPSFPNVGIYEAYSQAHYEFWKTEPESTERALSLLEKAIEAFGEHPLLVSGVGAIHWQLYHYRGDTNEAHLVKIKECARKLFASDPISAPGHRLLSYLALHAGATVEAIRHLQRAVEGDPGDAETLLWLSYLLAVHAGQPEQAQPIAERWYAIDPLHPIGRMSLELVPWMKGDLKSAAKGVEEWYNQDPHDQIRAFYLGHLLAWTGRNEESLRLAEKMVRQDPGDGMGQTLRFLALAINGRTEEAKKVLPPSIRESVWMDFHLPWLMAEGYALLGDKEEALRWLERAVERGNFNYPLWNEIDPLLVNLRGEPRFRKLMERVKYEWEHFEV